MTKEQLKRLETEREELTERMEKLSAFIGTAPFNALDMADRQLLTQQKSVMQDYYNILTRRLIRERTSREKHNPDNTPLL